MKRNIFRTLALALALALMCGAALAEVRTTGNVWMRATPNLKGEEITSIAEGKSLTYLGENSVDERGVTWYKVSDGKNTGWVSSKYSTLIGETAKATEAPTAVPTAHPTAQPTEAPATGLPAAGLLFSSLLNGEGNEPVESGETEAPATPATPADGQVVELSQYYQEELVIAANEIGLISYRQVESEAPFQYYDDAVIVAGNQYVENMVIYGPGYEIYGVHVGMNANAAMAFLNAAGLDCLGVDSMNGVTYEHRAAADSTFFVDENGHDSCINLWVNEDNEVIEIDWSTYTG